VTPPRVYGRGLRRALQWRLLLLWIVAASIPTALALAPTVQLLSGLLDWSPRARDLVARLDSGTLVDLLRKLAEAAPTLKGGLHAGLVAAVLMGPALAGAAVAVARSDEPLRMRALLAGAGEHYGRLLRLLLVGAVPLGFAVGLSSVLLRAAASASDRALTETQAVRGNRLALVASFLLFFLAQLTLDAGRAWFAAEPHRRSAIFAWWSGVRLIVREPLRAAGLGAVTLALGGGFAAAFLLLRLRIHQTGPGTVALAFVLGELAAASIGWHRTARVVGFAELARAHAAPSKLRLALVETRATPRPVPDPEPPPPAPPPPGPDPKPPGPREGSLSERSGSGT
jgi:hypothetical protein